MEKWYLFNNDLIRNTITYGHKAITKDQQKVIKYEKNLGNLTHSEGHYVTKNFFIRFQLLEAMFFFIFIPWNLQMIKNTVVMIFTGLGLSNVMTSNLTMGEFFLLQNKTFFILFERKFNANQLVIENILNLSYDVI